MDAGAVVDELTWLLESVDTFPKVKAGTGADGAGAGVELFKGIGAAGASLPVFDPNEKAGWLDEVAVEPSTLRRFFFELASSLPSVATLPSGRTGALVLEPNENPVAAGVVGATEAGTEVLPNENPEVVAGTVVEDTAELFPKEKPGALCWLSEPCVAEVSPSFFRFWIGSLTGIFGDSCSGIRVIFLLAPNENFGAVVEIAPESGFEEESAGALALEDPKVKATFEVTPVGGELDADTGAGAGILPN
mmetsp:Transcript_18960/g.41206  ORF Transcript_18960/g.41206 Transcript_18960/m.41206 type:complete len:248 (-) Transcript_18960:225-968(-)